MKREYKHVIFIVLAVMVLVNLPLMLFTVFGKDELHFLGKRVINSQDTYTYLSYIEQSKQGSWLLENLYTSETQTATLVRPSYVVIGKAAGLLHVSSLAAYHGSRVLLGIVFASVLYLFIRKIFEKESHRLITFIMALTSSGWGFWLGRTYPQSADLWIPEANTFLTLGESPHFILAQTLMVGGLMSFLKFSENKHLKWAIATCLCLIPLAFEHPFDLLVVTPVLFGLAFLHGGVSLKKTIMICVISAIGLLYPILELKSNPLYAMEQAQGASISPAPFNYLIGLGFLVPLALVGAERLLKSLRSDPSADGETRNQISRRHEYMPLRDDSVPKSKVAMLLLVWVGIGVILLYAPVTFQRRMSEGLHIPVAILASAGLIFIYELIEKRVRQLAAPIMILTVTVLALGSLFSIWTDYLTMNNDTTVDYHYFISKADMKGIEWLGENTQRGDIVLSNWFYGNLMPGMIGRKVFLGHVAQTIRFSDKVAMTNRFLLEQDERTARDFLDQNNIKYIFLGKNDSMRQYGFKPEEKGYLEKVFENEEASVWRVK